MLEHIAGGENGKDDAAEWLKTFLGKNTMLHLLWHQSLLVSL
jgi:hypothetical protein